MTRRWKVGELAQATGLTVRTLHHWDDKGLVTPSQRSASGHRLYTEADIERAYQVVALRELGLSLDAIGDVLAGVAPDLGELLDAHVGRVREQLAALRSLESRLSLLRARTRRAEVLSPSDLLELIDEVTTMDETVAKYYTPAQLETLYARREQLGDAHITEAQSAWPPLIAAVQAEMEAGTDPGDPRVAALAERWMTLLDELDGGDPAIRENSRRMITENPCEAQAGGAPAPELMDYIGRANAARG